MMPTVIQENCNTIEECYEFALSYAAQGFPSDEGSESGKQVRRQLARAVEAMRSLEECCASTIKQEQFVPAEKYQAFFAVLVRDAQSSIAAIELVLAQPVISSQLVDNLDASMHLRALLTDLFLVTEILELQQAKAMASN